MDPGRECRQQRLPVRPLQAEQGFALPMLSWCKLTSLAIYQDLQPTARIEPELAAEALAARKRQQQPACVLLHQQQVVDCVIVLVRRDAIDARIRAAPHRLWRAPGSHGLGQHLEPLAVDGRRRVYAEIAVKQQPITHGLRRSADVVEPYPAQGAVPGGGLQQLGRQGGIGGQLAQPGQQRGGGHGISF
ncbi:hypothetical protein D3C79_786120 [compost metagenome]